MKGVVSKETVVLRQWGSSIQKIDFINRVDNVNWPPYRILKADIWSVSPSSVDKTKFLFTSQVAH